MKKIIALLICLFCVQYNFGSEKESTYTQIPDANFEAALEALGYDDTISGDGQIPTANIVGVTSLDVQNLNISDLTGIEAFTALEQLYFSNNNISSIDVSNLTSLVTLWGVSNNLTTIDLSNNTLLDDLRIEENSLTSIDLSNAPLLRILQINNNELTSIDVSNNPLITRLRVNDNNISTLDLTQNTALTEVRVQNNNLNSFDMRNGTNTIITIFEADNNYLYCILVDDIAYSTTNWTTIDAQTTFTDTSCGNYTTVPDANFEAALDALGYDDISGDGLIPTANIETVTNLDIRSEQIADLTGIEAFVALVELRVNFNDLTSVNLSQNTALQLLYIGDNNLTSVDISANTNLNELSITDLDLSGGIDLSNNTNLTILAAENSNLNSIDLSNNSLLIDVDLRENNLTTLDITNLTALEELLISDNQLSTIDLSNNTALNQFSFESNNFTSLDFSGLANLTIIDGSGNGSLTSVNLTGLTSLDTFQVNTSALTSLDVSDAINLTYISILGGQVQTLDLSNNTALTTIQIPNNDINSLDLRNIDLTQITFFSAFGNDNLECISVDDVAVAEANLGSDFRYSIDCSLYTYVPDDNFEAALEALGYDDISGDDSVPTAAINSITSLDISNQGIADLTGIEGFAALTNLNASQNNLETIDVSANTTLQIVNLEGNSLKVLDVSTLPNLTSLEVDQNDLFSLNIQNGANTSLSFFDATQNADLTCILVDSESYATTNFTNIDNQTSFNETDCTIYISVPDATFETALAAYDDISNDGQVPFETIYFVTTLEVDNLGIADLTGIEAFTSLTYLDCGNNALTSVDLTSNLNLETLYIDNNALTTLDLSQNTALIALNCDNNSFSSLDFTNNINLEYLSADDNSLLTSLDITGCTLIEELIIDDNNLSAIDLSTNLSLRLIDIDNNNLTTIDFTNNILLEDIDVESNQLTSINISTLVNLVEADLQDNALTAVDFSNNVALENVDIDENQVTALDFSNNVALTRVDGDENSLLTTVTFGNSPNLAQVYIDDTALEAIDVSMLTGLEALDVGNTNIMSLDVSANTALRDLRTDNTNLVSLDLRNGNNSNFFRMEADGNASLTCIMVDDATAAVTEFTDVDSGVVFSETTCGYTVIPDANFETALATYDDISSDGLVPTANIESLTTLEVNNTNIVDLTGIEDFVSLTTLEANKNDITAVNLSKNTALTTLDLSDNLLTEIDLSTNTLLQEIDIEKNDLTSIDVSSLANLQRLFVQENNLSSIDVSNNSQLTELLLEDNPSITSLDLSNNNSKEFINCNNCTSLATITLGTSNDLETLQLDNTIITNLDLSTISTLREISVVNTNLTTLDLSNNSNLIDVYASDGIFTSINIQNGGNTGIDEFEIQNNPDLYCVLVDDEAYANTNFTSKDAQTTYNETSCDFVVIDVDVFLQGALINPNIGEENLMRDDLRLDTGSYGSISPYGDGASISETVGLNDNGDDSMVDWIWVELRDADNPTTVIAGQSGVLQRDGDVVATSDDLASPLTFENVPVKSYYVVIKHRNHFGIMTANTIALNTTATTVDFTDPNNEITFGTNAQINVSTTTNMMAMWTGNVNGDTIIQYSGVSPDTTDILSLVLNDASNFLNFPTYVVNGYNAEDVNLDGDTQYSGTTPDTPVILQNVLADPGNFLGFSTYQIIEQLPENLIVN
jgi:Leucine-rich repeat (LRR) protein